MGKIIKKIRFEIGQERAQVSFLIACSFAGSYKRFENILKCRHPEVIIKIFEEEYASLFSVADLNKLFGCIESSLIPSPENYYKFLKKQFLNDYSQAKTAVFSANNAIDRIKGGATALFLLIPYIPALRYYEATALRRLKHLLSNRNIFLADNELFSLVSPATYTSMITKERINILKIALKYYKKENNPKYKLALKRHTNIYGAYMLHGSSQNPSTAGDFGKHLGSLFFKPKNEIKKEYNKLIAVPLEIKKQKKRINKKYCFQKKEKALIRTLELSSEIKARITDANFVLSAIAAAAEELSGRWRISKAEIYKMRPEEIISCRDLTNFPAKLRKTVKERRRVAIWVKNNRVHFFYGQKALDFTKVKIAEEPVVRELITGIPIFKGKLTGRAVVVRSINDFPKVKPGDVLVCGDFTPDFVILADKIAAIIANEGGVMSHAAIVAREMKIPCIAGTKNATKVIRDGNIVELDGARGLVKVVY